MCTIITAEGKVSLLNPLHTERMSIAPTQAVHLNTMFALRVSYFILQEAGNTP